MKVKVLNFVFILDVDMICMEAFKLKKILPAAVLKYNN